jgi:hypothetical protein
MARSASIVVLGLAVSVLAAMLPMALIWAVIHADEIAESVVAFGRRCHLLPPPRILTYDPPIERTAADLRRLSAEMRQVPRGTSAVRRRGLQMAYDDKLTEACRSLGVRHWLGELGEGTDRELERMRVEAALEEAGLRFRPPVTS